MNVLGNLPTLVGQPMPNLIVYLCTKSFMLGFCSAGWQGGGGENFCTKNCIKKWFKYGQIISLFFYEIAIYLSFV